MTLTAKPQTTWDNYTPCSQNGYARVVERRNSQSGPIVSERRIHHGGIRSRAVHEIERVREAWYIRQALRKPRGTWQMQEKLCDCADVS
jgi:hypothetical protein